MVNTKRQTAQPRLKKYGLCLSRLQKLSLRVKRQMLSRCRLVALNSGKNYGIVS